MFKRTLMLAVFSSLAFGAAAQTRVDERQHRQEHRIEHGIASGALTPREAARLEHGQRHVERLERRAHSDGVVTHRERARLEHAQDVQSARIWRQKHDRQHDFDRDGRIDRPRRAAAR